MASRTFDRELNADKRKYPSPANPTPLPGDPTTLTFWRRKSKKSQDVIRSGTLFQI